MIISAPAFHSLTFAHIAYVLPWAVVKDEAEVADLFPWPTPTIDQNRFPMMNRVDSD